MSKAQLFHVRLHTARSERGLYALSSDTAYITERETERERAEMNINSLAVTASIIIEIRKN